MDRNRENLDELLSKFFTADEKVAAAKDILIGDEILLSHPAAEPSEDVLAGIQTDIAIRLEQKRIRQSRISLYKAAAAVAVFTAIAWVGVQFFAVEEADDFVISAQVWESSDLAADDPELAALAVEIEEIVSGIAAVQLGEDSEVNGDLLIEAELELMEIETTFWEG